MRTKSKTPLAATALLALAACAPPGEPGGSASMEAPEAATGPHGGRLLAAEDLLVELAIFESGVPPEYRAWTVFRGSPVDPAEVSLTVELARLGGVVDHIGFAPAGEYLRGDREVYEPHSFDVRVRAELAGRTYDWAYASYEGRTEIPAEVARAAGIETGVAGPGTIVETLTLYGAIAPDPSRVREVGARFPGLIRGVARRVGEAVAAGDALATIESNESLQVYTVTAPIAGVVTTRYADPGERAGEGPLFEIADYTRVFAELAVFPRDRPRVRVGSRVRVAGEGDGAAVAVIDYVAPLGDPVSQSVTARAVLDNTDGRWTPGQFVEATVTTSETAVELVVPLSALQTFRDFDVVFARFDGTYEVRMLELGRRDAERVEVLSGLAPGTTYVTENSYLVKADIEKSGATHDH